jgi:hypothetical protein
VCTTTTACCFNHHHLQTANCKQFLVLCYVGSSPKEKERRKDGRRDTLLKTNAWNKLCCEESKEEESI